VAENKWNAKQKMEDEGIVLQAVLNSNNQLVRLTDTTTSGMAESILVINVDSQGTTPKPQRLHSSKHLPGPRRRQLGQKWQLSGQCTGTIPGICL
jgi:hypothetical protein